MLPVSVLIYLLLQSSISCSFSFSRLLPHPIQNPNKERDAYRRHKKLIGCHPDSDSCQAVEQHPDKTVQPFE